MQLLLRLKRKPSTRRRQFQNSLLPFWVYWPQRFTTFVLHIMKDVLWDALQHLAPWLSVFLILIAIGLGTQLPRLDSPIDFGNKFFLVTIALSVIVAILKYSQKRSSSKKKRQERKGKRKRFWKSHPED